MARGFGSGRFPARYVLLAAAALLLAGAATLVWREEHRAAAARPIGLFTSLPILWREEADLAGLLQNGPPPHWALAVFARHGVTTPLDSLAGKAGKLPLPRGALLVFAQPRPLSPAENVALDDWVRGGGRVLLFADPMLTAHSSFALGDKRRPQDIALLSPILARWGLQLQFDERQPYGEREIPLFRAVLPVNLPGRFAAAATADCAGAAEGLVMRCRIGAGRVLAIADAALLEAGAPGDEARRRAIMLDRLIAVLAD